MHVIIVGAGKVGFSIAQMLSRENHDVVVVESDQERRQVVEDNLDVQTLQGNGASIKVLEEAGIRQADLLIAVTEMDELNMVACFLAKSLGVRRTIARVRDPEYVDSEALAHTCLDIDLIINPERVAAKHIAELVDVPEALNVEYYAEGKVMLVELPITADAPVVNKKLKELKFSHPFLIAAILREGRMIVPRGEDKLLPGDQVFVLAETRVMKTVERLLGRVRSRIETVFILGGGRLGFYLAKLLEKKGKKVKVLEKNLQKCRVISEQLARTMVLHGDGTDIQLLEQEDAGKVDLFVAVTGDDKVNLLVSLLAKELGAKKTIAQIRRSDYVPLVEKVGIDAAISPRTLTAGAILKYIRRGDVVSVSLLDGVKAETMEIIVPQRAPIINKALSSLKFPGNALIGAVARDNHVIIPSGSDVLLPGDHVIVFAIPEAVSKVEQFFTER